MLLFPLLRDLHVESASVATALGTFLATWLFSRPSDPRAPSPWPILVVTMAAFAAPIVVRALLASCVSIDGILFWITYPTSALLFGAAVGTFFRSWNIRRPWLPAFLLLLWIALGVWLIEFFTLPQVRFFNHVWGHFPGPVYDEEVLFTHASIHFRLITILWAAVLWLLSQRPLREWARWILFAAVILLVTTYLRLPDNAVVTPRTHIQKVLGGEYTSNHFTIYYDTRAYSSDDIEKWVLLHELYRSHILEVLELDPSTHMLHTESYLYRHVWQKKQLTGAKYTSYVPVWNSTNQTHIAKEALEGTLHHELVHVAAKAFGNRIINASWSFGLIEGLAVAVVPDISDASTIDQMVAASPDRPNAETLQSSLSFTSFYTGRGGVNYTTSGSFVRWLMREYPVSYMKEAYRTGSFNHYGVPFESLVHGWNAMLDSILVDTTDRQTTERVFGRLSLFELDCPRQLTPLYKAYDRSKNLLMEGDTLSAAEFATNAWLFEPTNMRLWQEAARLWIMAGKPERLLAMDEDSMNILPAKKIYHADAHVIKQDSIMARQVLTDVSSESLSTSLAIAVQRRMNGDWWKQWLAIQYKTPLHWPKLDKATAPIIQAAISNGGLVGRVDIPYQVQEWLPTAELDMNTLERLSLQLRLLNRSSEARWVFGQIRQENLRDRELERLDLLHKLIHR
jgi:hypothetical protein